MDSPILKLKVVLLGDSSVGKTCLINRLITGRFNPKEETTINAMHNIYDFNFQEKIVQLQIWDTAGEEKFHYLAPMYYHGAVGALIVYDITDEPSFERAKFWIEELHRNATTPVIFLVGNKIDLENQRKISLESIESFAEENSLFLMETSAKTGENVEITFRALAKQVSGLSQIDTNSIIIQNDEKKKGHCC
ncbi:ras-related protein rab-37 [Anaeramoeba ignava]|uniref:Ras-related protein rab-37 n=1 Tax=Anaeramoeba ignava TaxID=1746090 RepID=A0A9Q0LVR5_ANAIG|nr:ras-related protein rab-37 [Anaeramoeba ignava]